MPKGVFPQPIGDLRAWASALVVELRRSTEQTNREISKLEDTLAPNIIAMFNGKAEDIPQGWVLCDGTNGTPDLRDKFIKGATNAGGSGGNKDHNTNKASVPESAGAVKERGGQDVNAITDLNSNNEPQFFELAFIMKVNLDA